MVLMTNVVNQAEEAFSFLAKELYKKYGDRAGIQNTLR
ncbi:MAG: hypothetical protein H6Q52_596 [Deltaproteobacteria bacterium]|nr:hypothetical protein [Deltaproteobacteria bacterium]